MVLHPYASLVPIPLTIAWYGDETTPSLLLYICVHVAFQTAYSQADHSAVIVRPQCQGPSGWNDGPSSQRGAGESGCPRDLDLSQQTSTSHYEVDVGVQSSCVRVRG